MEPEALHRGIDVILEKAASGLEPSFEEFKVVVLAGGSVAAESIAGELRSADAEAAGSKTRTTLKR